MSFLKGTTCETRGAPKPRGRWQRAAVGWGGTATPTACALVRLPVDRRRVPQGLSLFLFRWATPFLRHVSLLALPVSTPIVFTRFTVKPLSQWFGFVFEARLGHRSFSTLWLDACLLSRAVFGCHLSTSRCHRPAEHLGGVQARAGGLPSLHPLVCEAVPSSPGYLDGLNPNSSIQPCEVSAKPLGLICHPRLVGLAPPCWLPWALGSGLAGLVCPGSSLYLQTDPKTIFLSLALPVGVGRNTVPL